MKKMLQKIFSVKNKKNHKIVRILGIKLKFRISEKNMTCSQKPVKLYDIKGQNNQIIIVENGNENIFDNIEVIDGLKIVINGNNNTIKLHKPFNLFNNVFIEIGNDNVEIEIEENCILERLHIRACFGTSQKCFIGKNTIHYGGAIVLDENTHCIIEPDCLIAEGLFVWASDGHTIYDNTTKKLLNKITSPVTIGKHTWIGFHVSIMKNSQIAPNSVIGTKSVVTGKFTEENTILAGSPAKIVKRNINWSGISPLMYENEHPIHEIEKNEELPHKEHTWATNCELFQPHCVDWFGSFKTYMLKNNMPEKIQKLKHGLDEKSIQLIDQFLSRVLILPDTSIAQEYLLSQNLIESLYTDEERRIETDYKHSLPEIKKKFVFDENELLVETFYFHNGLKFCTQKMKNYLKGKDFIDGGAYIGDSALIFSKYYNPRKIYSFEISKKLSDKYIQTMKQNHIDSDKYILISKGISDKCSENLFEDGALSGTSLLFEGKDTVELTSIDIFAQKNILNIGFIKLDVEGYAYEAIQGATQSIKKFRPIISVAIYHSPKEFFETKLLLEEILQELNYKIEIKCLQYRPWIAIEYILFAYPKELDN